MTKDEYNEIAHRLKFRKAKAQNEFELSRDIKGNKNGFINTLEVRGRQKKI